MKHDTKWLIKDFPAALAHLEGEVGIFVIGRSVLRVEAAELREERCWNHHTGGRAVINLAQIVKFRFGRVLKLSAVPTRAVAPDNAAGFLQTTIRINQFGSDEPGLGFEFEGFAQGRQPALGHSGIIVKKDKKLPAGRRRAAIA